MRINLWKCLSVLALAVSISGFGAARLHAQMQDRDRDQDQIQNQDRDRDQNRDPDRDRMQNQDRDRDQMRDRDRDQGYYNRDRDDRGNWGQPGWNNNPAYRFGFQDGLTDGAADRQHGHKFSVRNDHKYKKGDHGYSSQFGAKDQYRNQYREAYERGYQQGYNGQGYNSQERR